MKRKRFGQEHPCQGGGAGACLVRILGCPVLLVLQLNWSWLELSPPRGAGQPGLHLVLQVRKFHLEGPRMKRLEQRTRRLMEALDLGIEFDW